VAHAKLLDTVKLAELRAHLAAEPCCSKKCLAGIPDEVLLRARGEDNLRFHHPDLSAHLAAVLRPFVREGHPMQYHVVSPLLNQPLPVCREAWRLLYGLSDYKVRKVVNMAKLGTIVQVRKMSPDVAPKRQQLVGYISAFFNQVCNPRHIDEHNRWILPAFMHPKHIYEDCVEQWKADPLHVGDSPPSLALLHNVLGRELKGQFHQPKEGDWGLCAVCQLLDMQGRQAGMDPNLKAQLQEEQERHTKTQWIERTTLEANKADAER
jgi:hypothetical protein